MRTNRRLQWRRTSSETKSFREVLKSDLLMGASIGPLIVFTLAMCYGVFGLLTAPMSVAPHAMAEHFLGAVTQPGLLGIGLGISIFFSIVALRASEWQRGVVRVSKDLQEDLTNNVDPTLKRMRTLVLSPELKGSDTARDLLVASIAQRAAIIDADRELHRSNVSPEVRTEHEAALTRAVEAIDAAAKVVENLHLEAERLSQVQTALELRAQSTMTSQTNRLAELTSEVSHVLDNQRTARRELEEGLR